MLNFTRHRPLIAGLIVLAVSLAACGEIKQDTTPTLPANPTGFNAGDVSASSITLRWDPVEAATAYRLERKTDTGDYAALSEPTTSPFTDTGLEPDTAYTYRLKTISATGVSSGVESATLTTAKLGKGPFGGTARSVPGVIKAEDYDDGGEGTSFHRGDGKPTSAAYRPGGVGIQAEGDSSGGYHVGDMLTGDWLEYTVATTAGKYDLDVRVSSALEGAQLAFSLSGAPIGTLSVANTAGAWQRLPIAQVLTLETGNRVLRVFVAGTAGAEQALKLDLMEFKPAPSPTITAVTFKTAPPSTLPTGQTLALEAVVTGTRAFTDTVNWSINPNTATLTPNPKSASFSSNTAGTYTITATSTQDPSKKASATVVVEAPPPTITAVTINPATQPDLETGQTATFQATVTGTAAFNNAVTWTVTPAGGTLTPNANNASFSSNAAGTYTVTATSVQDPSKKASVTVKFKAPPAPNEGGKWSGVIDLPKIPVHAAIMPSGKVLFWGYDENPQTTLAGVTRTYLWDAVNNGTPVRVDNPISRIFCSGHSLLPDGRLFVAGGVGRPTEGFYWGPPDTNIYSETSNTWTKVADMKYGRFYPSTTVLGNGEVLVTSGEGSKETGGALVQVPEVWQTNSPQPESSLERYRELTGVNWKIPYYPMAFQAPNGKAFVLGPQRQMGEINAGGSGTWKSLGDRNDPVTKAREYGNAVMYQAGKILLVGGADPPTATALVVDINGANPSATQTGSMSVPRRQHNATVLPNGEVLITGGSKGAGFNNYAERLYSAELWNPTTGQFRTLSSMATPRVYHSLAILLPDARVLVGGGSGSDAPDFSNAEIFSPPYLFQADGTPAPRPSILTAPDTMSFGSSFNVTASSTAISRVTLVKLGSVTHSTNFDQRFLELAFTKSGADLSVNAPSSGNAAPPGYYMLFVIDSSGVPSSAKVIKVG